MQRNHNDLIKAYLNYSSSHESTERVRKWSFISVLAASLERRIWLNLGYYTLYPNLYVFIIGRSGLIKKSTTTGIAVDLYRELKGGRLMSERLTAASLIEQLYQSGKTFKWKGLPVKQSPLFAYASELSVVLQEVYGSITELLTTFYDCIPHDPEKAWVNFIKKEGERKIYGPCLNILGASTKSWLRKCIPVSEMEGGFTSRIIFVVENNLPEKLVAWPDYDVEREEQRIKIVEDLRHIHTLIGPITFSPDARLAFSRWYENHMRSVLPMNQDPRMIGYMSRKGDTIRKLAMIHSLSCRDDREVTIKDLIWATDEIDEIESDWRLAFDGLSVPEGLDYEIMQYVRKKVEVDRMEVIDTFSQVYPATEVVRAITNLLSMEEIAQIDKKEPTGTKTIYRFSYA